jgi:PAS domain S-box-containing protein
MRCTNSDSEQALRQINDLDRRINALEVATEGLRARAARNRAVLETALDAIVVIDDDGNVIEFNPAAERMFGYARAEALGRDLGTLVVPPALREAHWAGISRYLRDRTPHMIGRRVEISAVRSDGSEFPVELVIQAVEVDGAVTFTGYIRDIAERLRAEDHLRFLAHAGELLSQSLDYEATLQSVARLVVPRFSDWCVVTLVAPDGTLQRLAGTHASPELEPVLHEMMRRFPPDPGGHHPVIRVLQTGTTYLDPNIDEDVLDGIARSADHRAMMEQLRPRSSLIVPLVANGETLGAIEFLRTREAWAFDDVDRALGEELARRAALAVDNASLHRETQRNLQQSEETRAVLETVLRSIPVGFAFLDRDLRFLRANEMLAGMHSIPPDDYIGRTVGDIVPSLSAQIEPYLIQALQTGEPVLNIDVMSPDATAEFTRPHTVASCYPVRTDTGSVLGVSVVVVDISVQRASEERARFLANASRVLSESLDHDETLSQVARLAVPTLADWCVVYMLEEDGEIARIAMEHANPSHQDLREEMQRDHRINPRATTGVPEVIRSGTSILRNDASPTMLAADSVEPSALSDLLEPLAVHAWMCVPMTVRGRTIGAVSFMATEAERSYDEADLALAEELGRRAATAIDNARLYKEAQEAIHLREQFLSIASHELKTPLTSVKAAGQLIERWSQDPFIQQERLVRVSHQLTGEVTRLETLVSDLLDASRVHQGRLELRRNPMDLAALATEVLQRYEHAPERLDSHQLVVDAPEPTIGEWDAARLDQVITNLVSNALKYSPDGGTVRVEVRKGVKDALLRISDEGIGVPLEEREHLFQPFSRSESVQGNFGGTGLGLFISAQIVELHGGTIGVTSRVGGGSAFTVTLPLNAPPRNEPPNTG